MNLTAQQTVDLKAFQDHAQTGIEYSEIWYITSPFAHHSENVMKKRIVDVKKAVRHILKTRPYAYPLSPLTGETLDFKQGFQTKAGNYRLDLQLLNKCDKLIVLQLEGWDRSLGVQLGIAFALGKGIPIMYLTLDEVENYNENDTTTYPSEIPF